MPSQVREVRKMEGVHRGLPLRTSYFFEILYVSSFIWKDFRDCRRVRCTSMWPSLGFTIVDILSHLSSLPPTIWEVCSKYFVMTHWWTKTLPQNHLSHSENECQHNTVIYSRSSYLPAGPKDVLCNRAHLEQWVLPLPVPKNKVLLKSCQAHSFIYF